jgi:hypothetical protein
LQSIAKANGGEMLGLPNRLKTMQSLARKIASSEPKRDINDALRYTMSFDQQNFTRGVQDTMATLKAQGYSLTKLRNTFTPGKSYMGINTFYDTPKGYTFELQFHTPASFDMKEGNHFLYEAQRVLPEGDPQIKALNQQMIRNSSAIPIPPGVSSIQDVR